MGAPLFLGLLVLIGAGFLNGVVWHAHWLETVCSLVSIVLFTLFSVFDANMFVRKRSCRYDCCEEGVFSLYVNFMNIAINLMDLNSSSLSFFWLLHIIYLHVAETEREHTHLMSPLK